MIFAYMVIQDYQIVSKPQLLFFGIILISCVCYLYFTNNMRWASNDTIGSVIVRIDSIIYGLKVWMRNPILGRGALLSQSEYVALLYKAGKEQVGGNTSNLILPLAQFGIIYESIFIGGIIKLFYKYCSRNPFEIILFIPIIFFLMSSQILLYSMWFIISLYGWEKDSTLEADKQDLI